MKTCLNCGKEIFPPQTTNVYLISNFKFKKFCSDLCRIEYNNQLKKKTYILKETEHNAKIKQLHCIVGGKIGHVIGKKDTYNPDIIKEEMDYELELFRNMLHLKKKVANWDKSRKHILVLAISDQTKDLFDEVYFLSKEKTLFKEK
jgi:hypothetical protein